MGATLARFVDLCHRLERTRGRLDKSAATADFLRALPPPEVPWAVAFLAGRPFPASDPRVLEVSWATLGELWSRLEPPAESSGLTLGEVARGFEEAAAARGGGARRQRLDRLAEVFGRATAAEREILRRVVQGEMRLGLHEGLLPEAIARAASVDAALVRRALAVRSDPSVVAAIALADGEAGLRGLGVTPFVPVLPMLAEPASDLAEALAAHGGTSAVEVKYDGARIQIHKRGGEVRIWSRRLTEVTASLPEIVAWARRETRASTCILDGEVVAVGPDGRPLPFQELMRRFRRVHDIEQASREVPLALYLFDCLLIDDRSLLDEPCAGRWEGLERLTGGAALARRAVVSDPAAARSVLTAALAAGHEGVIVKALESPYTPGTRGRRWFKVKPAETIDCVIVAADRGSGRRRGWLSNYHLAVRAADGTLAPVGKTFKGLTDREFEAMTARLRSLAEADDGYTVRVAPEVVVEVAYNEVQRSPQYASGFALRFARIARIRDDRGPAGISSLAELQALYDRQFAAKSRGREP